MEVLNSLFVIFVIVLLGILSRKMNIFAKEHIKIISAFIYYFALPALFFVQVSEMDVFSLNYLALLISILPIIVILIILYLLKAFHLISKDNFILLSLSTCLSSHAFFGVAFFKPLYGGIWYPLAIVTASIHGLTGITLILLLFEYAHKKDKGIAFLLKIIKNPLVISLFIGLLFSVFKLRFNIINSALSSLGQTAGVLAIFSLGIYIHDNFSVQVIKKAFMFSLFRIIMLPIVTYLTIFLIMDKTNELNTFLLVQSGIPIAISLVVFAQRYEYKIPEIAGMVVITSIFSFVGLSFLFYLSKILF